MIDASIKDRETLLQIADLLELHANINYIEEFIPHAKRLRELIARNHPAFPIANRVAALPGSLLRYSADEWAVAIDPPANEIVKHFGGPIMNELPVRVFIAPASDRNAEGGGEA